MGKTYNLRPLWDELINIYCIIAEICERNHLRYFSNGGTTIGALRHNGFIPWDDDLDLYMPRPDYEKFMDIAKRELSLPYVWQSIETDEHYGYLFGKVRLSNPDKVSKIADKVGLRLGEGVYVDIFALDGFPSGKLNYWLFCIKRGILRRAASGMYWWGRLFSMGRNLNANLKKLQGWYSSYKYDECELVSAVSPYDDAKTPNRWVFRREWFESANRTRFEQTSIPVPCGAHQMLTGVFGDYMQLPPLEKRVPSHQVL